MKGLKFKHNVNEKQGCPLLLFVAMVADFVSSIGFVAKKFYPLRTMRLMAADAGMPSIYSFFVPGAGEGMPFFINPRAGMGLLEYALMAFHAESVDRLPEEFPVSCRMSLVTFHALAVLDRRVHDRLYELRFPMAVQA